MSDVADEISHLTSPAQEHLAGELFLIDASGFIFRAFHALPPLTRADGTPVNAVLGFTNMVLKLLTETKATQIAAIFDAKRENFRNQIFADYKANRTAAPDELIPQFAIIREAVEAFCIPAVELEGYEADDLIATYARQAQERGWKATIVSSDKDLMQLVREGVGMYDPIKYKPLGAEEVFEKFGVRPDRVADVQALAGDSVDNVPGVPGIGIKTAAQLITEYGDLESLLNRAHEIKQPKRRESLTQYAEQARISKKLVLLDDQVPVPTALEDLTVREPDHDRLIAFLREQGFRTTLARLETQLREEGRLAGAALTAHADATAPAAEARIEAVTRRYELVDTPQALLRWIAMAREMGRVAVNTEQDELIPSIARLVGVALAIEPGQACYIPLRHVGPAGEGVLSLEGAAPQQLPLEEAVRMLKPLLEDPAVLKIAHNAKIDLQVLAQHGITLSPIDDVMMISYALNGASHGHGISELATLYCGHSCTPRTEVCGTGKNQITFNRVPLDCAKDYAAENADMRLRIHRALKPRLAAERMATLYETIERPLMPVVARMERHGIKIDPQVLSAMSRDFAERLHELEGRIYGIAGHPFTLGSPKQLGDVLFGELGLTGGRKSKTGGYSTHADILEPLAEQGHEIVKLVLDWRQLSKLKSTYTDALQTQVEPSTGRIHTSYSLAATNTGRLSSTDPNLQNIPIRTEEGRKIRRAFIADEGNVLLSIDYSQIELRLVAQIAGIDALKQAFLDGHDIHAMTASQVFGVPLDQMTADIRRNAKAINFGIIYGISGFGLGQQLGISAGEANAYIRQYLDRFWQLREYMTNMRQYAREHGYVVTLFGRKCHMPGIAEKNPARRSFAERQATNAPIQGTAADIMRRAMVKVDRALSRSSLSARMLLQVHDELVFEVPEAEAEETAALVKQAMEAAAHLEVPLVADAGWGKSWAEAH